MKKRAIALVFIVLETQLISIFKLAVSSERLEATTKSVSCANSKNSTRNFFDTLFSGKVARSVPKKDKRLRAAEIVV